MTLSRVTVTAAQPLMSIFMILICQMTLFLEVLGCVHRFRWLRMNFEWMTIIFNQLVDTSTIYLFSLYTNNEVVNLNKDIKCVLLKLTSTMFCKFSFVARYKKVVYKSLKVVQNLTVARRFRFSREAPQIKRILSMN